MGNKQLQQTTRKEEVLLYLKQHGSITAFEGFKKLYIIDLAGIIRDLRKDFDIKYSWIYTKNKYGRPIQFKRYFLPEEERLSLLDRIRLFM